MKKNMSDFYMMVGLRVRALRTERNLSREEFAEAIDISSKYVYEIEKGTKNFSIGILFRICRALNIPSSIILDEEVSIEMLILNELVGKFTDEDKKYIKDLIVSHLLEDK